MDGTKKLEAFRAVTEGNLPLLRSLLIQDPQLVFKTDEDDDTLLHKAAVLNQVECCRLLLEGGSSVSSLGCSCRTPLHCAVWEGHLPTVSLLLEVGAEIFQTDSLEETVLHKAATTSPAMLRLVLQHVALQQAQHHYSLDQLLRATNVLGNSPLMNAVHRGHVESTRLLLEVGADPSQEDNFGYTPLAIAQMRGYHEIVALLNAVAS